MFSNVNSHLIWLIGVDQHVQLLSRVIIYDVEPTIRNGRIDFWCQEHLLINQEHLSKMNMSNLISG